MYEGLHDDTIQIWNNSTKYIFVLSGEGTLKKSVTNKYSSNTLKKSVIHK